MSTSKRPGGTVTFGQRVATLRKARLGERSLSKLAREIGITPAALAKIEKGGFARLPTIEAIVRITGCSRDWLFAGEGQPAAVVREHADDYLPTDAAGQDSSPQNATFSLPPKAWLAEIPDDTFAPLALPSQCLICIPERPRDGDLALVEMKGERRKLVRRVYFRGKNVCLAPVTQDRPKQKFLIVPADSILSMHRIWGVKV